MTPQERSDVDILAQVLPRRTAKRIVMARKKRAYYDSKQSANLIAQNWERELGAVTKIKILRVMVKLGLRLTTKQAIIMHQNGEARVFCQVFEKRKW